MTKENMAKEHQRGSKSTVREKMEKESSPQKWMEESGRIDSHLHNKITLHT